MLHLGRQSESQDSLLRVSQGHDCQFPRACCVCHFPHRLLRHRVLNGRGHPSLMPKCQSLALIKLANDVLLGPLVGLKALPTKAALQIRVVRNFKTSTCRWYSAVKTSVNVVQMLCQLFCDGKDSTMPSPCIDIFLLARIRSRCSVWKCCGFGLMTPQKEHL